MIQIFNLSKTAQELFLDTDCEILALYLYKIFIDKNCDVYEVCPVKKDGSLGVGDHVLINLNGEFIDIKGIWENELEIIKYWETEIPDFEYKLNKIIDPESYYYRIMNSKHYDSDSHKTANIYAKLISNAIINLNFNFVEEELEDIYDY